MSRVGDHARELHADALTWAAGGESTKRTVYMVTSGAYSDYHVDCVFENREDAERYVTAGMGEDIEETELYSTMPAVYTVYTAQIDKRGGYQGQAGALRFSDSRTTVKPEHEASEWEWAFSARGPDRERVIKSVRDRYAAWKARQEQVT